MTMVNDARSALQNGASTVLSTVRHNKTTRRLLPANTQKMMKQWNRRLQTRRTPVLPIVLVAVGLSLAGTVSGIVLGRYLAAKREEAEAAMADEATPAEEVIFVG
ncbi:MAG TPA: hypothetical protein VFU63_05190 [Ktedonobacterales bacterium]|nr:hypothetical protein [Ktedonobacterales bacterium]